MEVEVDEKVLKATGAEPYPTAAAVSATMAVVLDRRDSGFQIRWALWDSGGCGAVGFSRCEPPRILGLMGFSCRGHRGSWV
ncbi:hypothetical protein CMV_016963 [Castanea mollissima]|uniref:Uncharacterized protein n=1 Tax=Castanea mollissima TaxID=60419 RepID=A0A8J4R2Z3_9ROSI|nr:hypothetical protein CMV_016963 [Castanea mollissima]